MHMAVEIQAHYMLESINKRLEAFRPLVKGAIVARGMVADYDGDLACCLHLIQCFFKPSEHTSRVISICHKIVIRVVACLCVHGNHSNVGDDCAV